MKNLLLRPLKLAAFTAGVAFAAWSIYVDWSNPSWTGKEVWIYIITGVTP